jgi:hypothetical protein
MTTGRKPLLALAAAILAAVFVFVVAGHAGVHSGSAAADPPCAMCGPAADQVVAFTPEAPLFSSPRVLSSTSEAPLLRQVTLEHPSRGPPSAG